MELGSGLADVVRLHQDPIRRYLAYLGCPPSEADDLVQEAFLAFLRAGARDMGYPATGSYLRKTARNLLVAHLRKRQTRPLLLNLDEADAAWGRFDRGDGGEGYLEALRGCLRSLQQRAVEALRLRYGEGRSREEIGRSLGLAVGGVKTLLERSKGLLRDCIETRLSA